MPTIHDKAAILRDGGKGWKEIGEILGAPWRTLQDRYHKNRGKQRANAAVAPIRRYRPCMTCGVPIVSTHHGHRRCGNCRARDDSPYEPDDGVSL